MIECIRFRSVLPFDENVKEEFFTIIWNDVTDRWGAYFTPDIAARLQMELDTFEQVDGYMEYLYFVWRVVIESNFFVMPYRTLAHASAVCYALGITEVDPIRLWLDFNRFMQTDNPRFAEIGIATNATALQIQSESQQGYRSFGSCLICAPTTSFSISSILNSASKFYCMSQFVSVVR